jgi:Zn-dependent peptidase ImmA (M78 family)
MDRGSGAASAGANFRMVRLARELRGLTQTQTAESGGLPQARLSRIETGQVEMAESDVAALSEALELPAAFFFEPGAPAAVPMFRKRAIRSARKLSTIQARLNCAVLIAQRLLAAGVDIDPVNHFPEPGELLAEDPVGAAGILRRDWRLPVGRVDDVTAVIESAAGIVLRVDFGSDDASAAFIGIPGDDARLWFLVNTREGAGDRVRLSLAHELGHAVLHRRLPSIEEGETEQQAFSFAAALLLPPSEFDRAVPFEALTLGRARDLKRTYGVSMQAIIRAAFERGRIGRSRYSSLYKQLSARQWRTTEPDPIPIEAPRIWPDVLSVHRMQHSFTDGDLAEIARVDQQTMTDLFPEDFRRTARLRAVKVDSLR